MPHILAGTAIEPDCRVFFETSSKAASMHNHK